jgi:hypothetical protein
MRVVFSGDHAKLARETRHRDLPVRELGQECGGVRVPHFRRVGVSVSYDAADTVHVLGALSHSADGGERRAGASATT